jgi:hypothetical protein
VSEENDVSLDVCVICGNDLQDKVPPRLDFEPPELPPPTFGGNLFAMVIIVPIGILAIAIFLRIMMFVYSN